MKCSSPNVEASHLFWQAGNQKPKSGFASPTKGRNKFFHVNTAIIILLLFIAPAVDQGLFSQVALRPQVGFNSSILTKDPTDGAFRNKLGAQFGFDVQIGGKVYFEPGILWQSNKNEFEERLDGTRNGFEVQRLYVPLMIGVRLFGEPINEIFDIRFFTGPALSYAVSKNLSDVSLLSKDDFKDAVVGWGAGIGFDASIVFLDVEYTIGISDALETGNEQSPLNLFHANAGVKLVF